MSINPMFLSDTVILETMADRLSYGLQTTLLGMSVVFAVLIILILVITMFGKAMTAGQKKPKVKIEKPNEKPNEKSQK